MALVVGSYLGLLCSIALPLFGFYVLDLPGMWTGIVATISAGLVLGIVLLPKGVTSASADAEVARHFRNQRTVLLIFAVGGILGSLRFFISYRQSIFSIPLLVATSVLWLVSVILIFRGLRQSCLALAFRRRVVVKQSSPSAANP